MLASCLLAQTMADLRHHFPHPLVLSHHLLCGQAQAGGFDAVFGGLGGDELNAGEYEYFIFHFADLKQAGEKVKDALND